MNIFEQAWQSIILPIQVKTKLSSYGPRKIVVDNVTIHREDISFFNRNNKKISGFVFTSPDYQTD
jgi:hypothetical protein